ncbi:MAG: hypothetical protein ABSF98_03245 [Bryobacteraceae bacterium]|jgi:hypothetical protein
MKRLLSSTFVLCAVSVSGAVPTQNDAPRLPGAPLGIAWGFLYGYAGTKAEVFMPQLRQLGAGITKVYLFWNQIEPEKGRFDWSAVDQFVGQLHSPNEGLISIFSSSLWATRRASAVLPPSPAKNPDDYYRFVHALVLHSKGRVRYWQNDSEPNNPIYWSGTKQEFVDELRVFHKAVKDADPDAIMVAGGYDGLFNPPGMFQYPAQKYGLDFFDYVIAEGSDAFDVFDLRLYADPYTIPWRVEHIRQMMRAHGHEKPILCTEYNGPGFFEFAPNLAYVPAVIKWAQSVADGDGRGGANEVAALYAKMSTLAKQTQMFMEGCPAELQRKLERLQARDLVMRNLLALSAGVRKTMYWDLWHDTSGTSPGRRDDMMHLMYAKCKLLEREGGALTKRYPLADAFERMAKELAGVESVERIEVPDRPSIYLFEVRRAQRAPLFVVWERRDVFSGEDQPAIVFDWPWALREASATDALGETVATTVRDGRVRLSVSVTPVFVTAP